MGPDIPTESEGMDCGVEGLTPSTAKDVRKDGNGPSSLSNKEHAEGLNTS
jgi:hypothetical protein